MKRGRKNKFDYDSDEFYHQIYILSAQGCTYKEIAQMMSLNPTVFSQMMNGKYRYWTVAENQRRMERLNETIKKGYLIINSLVRNALLRFALGGIILHTTIRRYVIVKDANGNIISRKEVMTKIIERELPPNINMLNKLLIHYDEEWRQAENLKHKKNEESVDENSPTKEWIKAKININGYFSSSTKETHDEYVSVLS